MSVRFPDVPFVPGVPIVLRQAVSAASALALPFNARGPLEAIGDAVNSVESVERLVSRLLNRSGAPDAFGADRVTWGLYNSGGTLALEADSVASLEPTREFRISDYPVEKGGFLSYNKVATPAETRITLMKGGSDADRQAFQDTLDTLIETTDLYSIVAADRVYLNRNLVRYSMRRTAESGATLLKVELVTVEVRQSAEASFSDTKAPSGANTSNNGPVQAVPAPAGPTATFS